ncbi:hypothetical protein [Actinomadura violacea]|uniref:Transcriptional regulator n=1 Tax=Actinomadura violacea TaxID=2819934 RepID=A0ABS3RXR9_9ACTN|nr:hypothetical protein [Actinomadura violacea]MBO2461548.1 hypothetical protein [Actinomadura violacea]
MAAEDGTMLRCAAQTLGKWLNGAIPLPATMAYAVEAFARLLDRPGLAPADLGWPPNVPAAPEDPWRGDPVALLTRIGREDMLDRRTTLTAGLYSLAAATMPDRLRRMASRPGEDRRAGASDIARIRETTKQFGRLDDLYGGGHGRVAVAAYITHEVTPLLRGTTGKARPELFVAAAELAYLAAWMAADASRAGTAQQYYVQAARLADEAGDPLMRACALRGLAVQAVELGHDRQAHDLAEAAAEGISGGAPLRTRAWITGMRAETLAAADRDRNRAFTLLREAESYLEKAESQSERWPGNYQPSSYQHQMGLTLAQLGDLKSAEQHFAASVRAREPGERRSRALIGARLAHIQVRRRQPDEAAYTLLGIASDLKVVSSGRIDLLVTQIRAAWQPYRGNTQVRKADKMLAGLRGLSSNRTENGVSESARAELPPLAVRMRVERTSGRIL